MLISSVALELYVENLQWSQFRKPAKVLCYRLSETFMGKYVNIKIKI